MTQALLFKTLVTRSNRYRKRAELLRALEAPSYTVNVSGCFVSQTSSYVDIELNDQETPVKLFEISAIKFTNTDYTDYIAFVDGIEPNNFNTNDNALYYRLYITIDWWSTIMLNDEDGSKIERICSELEGNVERAHVNDCELGEDNNFHKTLRYTTKSAEVRSFKTKNDLYAYLTEVPNRKFLWILSNRGVTTDVAGYSVGGRVVPFQYNLYILPLFTCELFGRDLTNIEAGLVNIGQIGAGQLNMPNCVDDRQAIMMYVSDYCPFYDYERNYVVLDFETTADLNAYQRTKFSLLGDNNEAYAFSIYRTDELLNLQPLQFYGYRVNSFNDYVIKTFKNNVVTIPINYDSYLATIAKIDYAPYTETLLVVDGVVEEILTELVTTDIIFEYSVEPSEGGIYAHFKYDLYNDVYSPSNYLLVSANNAFPPMSINDEFTATTRMTSTLKQLGAFFSLGGSAGKTAGKFVSGDIVGGIASSSNLIGEGLQSVGSYFDTASKVKQLSLLGENGYKASASNLIQYFTPNMIGVFSPIDTDRRVILKDLSLYGYNTYLHPHEVLIGHERKFFNYIKTNNANANIPTYPTDVRLAIEEMFNNGVWLWNDTDQFMNFEVPNYPIIMEDN